MSLDLLDAGLSKCCPRRMLARAAFVSRSIQTVSAAVFVFLCTVSLTSRRATLPSKPAIMWQRRPPCLSERACQSTQTLGVALLVMDHLSRRRSAQLVAQSSKEHDNPICRSAFVLKELSLSGKGPGGACSHHSCHCCEWCWPPLLSVEFLLLVVVPRGAWPAPST